MFYSSQHISPLPPWYLIFWSAIFLLLSFCLFVVVVVVVVVAISWAAPAAYGGSQAKGLIGVVATGLCQSHSHTGSEAHLQPTPQLMATPDP